jgi:hypothetical protein
MAEFNYEWCDLIGINGEIGSGKSTAANYLCDKYAATEYMFAKPLKEIAKTLGFKDESVYGTQEEKLAIDPFWGISGREFLQVFGTEVCRDFLPKVLPNMNLDGTTLWVRLFEKYIADIRKKRKECKCDDRDDCACAYLNLIVVSDLRFEDESNSIKKHRGYVIRIVRDNKPKEAHNKGHASETQADKIKPNIIINNNGSLQDLYSKLEKAMKLIDDRLVDITNSTTYL